jgi:hypothetical protein
MTFEKTETDTRIAEAQAKRAQLIQQTALAGIKLALDIAELRTEIAQVESRIVRALWIQGGVIIGAVVVLVKLL